MPTLSLSDRLAILRKTSPIPDVDDLEGEAQEEAIDYRYTGARLKVNEKLFLALYTPYILHPLEFDWFIYRDFKPFLLGDDFYILNTFDPLSIDRIFFMYLKKIKPRRMKDFARLTHFCGHLELCVPAIYQQRIEALISSIKS